MASEEDEKLHLEVCALADLMAGVTPGLEPEIVVMAALELAIRQLKASQLLTTEGALDRLIDVCEEVKRHEARVASDEQAKAVGNVH